MSSIPIYIIYRTHTILYICILSDRYRKGPTLLGNGDRCIYIRMIGYIYIIRNGDNDIYNIYMYRNWDSRFLFL